MTEKIAAAARAVAPLDEIVAITCFGSPPAIEGPEDDAACRPVLFAEIARAEREGASAVVIACFDDPGLDEAGAAEDIPGGFGPLLTFDFVCGHTASARSAFRQGNNFARA